MLQRRHFELVAEIIRAALPEQSYDQSDRYQLDIARTIAEALARAFSTTNPRFDRARFLRACGLE